MPESKRAGLIDLGSNAIRWELVEFGPEGPHSLDRRRVPLRIGSEVFATGGLSAKKIRAVAEVFSDFAAVCASQGIDRILGVGTSASREANNRGDLRRAIAESSGISLELISGEEEGALLLRAVASIMDLRHGSSLLVDLGGGSIEVACLDAGRISTLRSHPLGALRFELGSGLRGRDLLEKIEQELRDRGSEIIEQVSKSEIERYVAIGGNLDSLLEIMRSTGDVDSNLLVPRLPVQRIAALLRTMAEETPAVLAERYGLGPDRADSIVPATAAYLWIAELVRVSEIWAPGVSLRDGLIARILEEEHSP